MGKRITILCTSFPPETGAAPQRMWHLAQLLQRSGHQVTVISAMPNYPAGKIFPAYRGKLLHREMMDGITIYRTWFIPSHSNSRMHRAWSMLSYTLSLWLLALPRLIRSKPQLLVLCSPPFITGYFGIQLSRFTKASILLNISDLWPQSALDLGFIKAGILYRFLQRLERRMYCSAAALSVQSEAIAKYLSDTVPGKKIFLYHNLLPEFPQAGQARPPGKRIIVYAGLLGVAQGIYQICEAINFAALGTELHIYGSGNEQERIQEFTRVHPDRGIVCHGSFAAAEIPELLTLYHFMLIPLKTAIAGALPSKIFNAMANGLPILFSGDGEGAALVQETGTGMVSRAGDYGALQQLISHALSLDDGAYETLRQNCHTSITGRFSRQTQDKAFIDFVAQI
jgi:glycosyltransferase involved in cell wall biosynthesis